MTAEKTLRNLKEELAYIERIAKGANGTDAAILARKIARLQEEISAAQTAARS